MGTNSDETMYFSRYLLASHDDIWAVANNSCWTHINKTGMIRQTMNYFISIWLLNFILRARVMYLSWPGLGTRFLIPSILPTPTLISPSPMSVSDSLSWAVFHTLLELLNPIPENHLHVDVLLINLGPETQAPGCCGFSLYLT